MNKPIFIFGLLSILSIILSTDPNFHIYLAFGQSNMQGYAYIESQDLENVPQHFKMMAAVDMPLNGRIKGNWYTAIPPLCRDNTGLSPCDYFGRELVNRLPDYISVGIINVAVAGCSIPALYGNHPYNTSVELGREAQKKGVIKGILLHQGESDAGDQNWPNNVKKIYDRIISDLHLAPNKVPLLVGEVVNADSGGLYADHNNIIAKVPNVIPNSYVIKSNGLPSGGDGTHFSAQSYREFGKRYAETMISILEKQNNKENNEGSNPNPNFHIYLLLFYIFLCINI